MLREAMAVAVAYDLPTDPGTTRQALSLSAAVLAEAGSFSAAGGLARGHRAAR